MVDGARRMNDDPPPDDAHGGNDFSRPVRRPGKYVSSLSHTLISPGANLRLADGKTLSGFAPANKRLQLWISRAGLGTCRDRLQ